MNRLQLDSLCSFSLLSLSLMMTTFTPGCGSRAEIGRYPVKGEVTFDNKPLKVATILIEPDSSKGNKGPAAMGEIRDGLFAIARDNGTVGGPHVIRIFDDETIDYTQEMDLAPHSSTLKISIPIEAARKGSPSGLITKDRHPG